MLAIVFAATALVLIALFAGAASSAYAVLRDTAPADVPAHMPVAAHAMAAPPLDLSLSGPAHTAEEPSLPPQPGAMDNVFSAVADAKTPAPAVEAAAHAETPASEAPIAEPAEAAPHDTHEAVGDTSTPVASAEAPVNDAVTEAILAGDMSPLAPKPEAEAANDEKKEPAIAAS